MTRGSEEVRVEVTVHVGSAFRFEADAVRAQRVHDRFVGDCVRQLLVQSPDGRNHRFVEQDVLPN